MSDLHAPFLHAGDTRGVVCIHGFTSSPQSVLPLAKSLAARGMTVHAPLLPGHGLTVDDLDVTPRSQWVAAVEQAFDEMKSRCTQVAVIGQSLGGLLALELASRREVDAVVSLAAPLWLDGLGGKVGRASQQGGLLRGRLSRVPKLGGADVLDETAKRDDASYQWIPLRALGELVTFMGEVEAALPRITAPLLLLHGVHDHTAPLGSAARIQRLVPHAQCKLLERSYHLLAVDVERDEVATAVGDFLEAQLGSASPS